MRIKSSTPDIIGSSLLIDYDNMKPEYIKGQEITITCWGFKNPIQAKKWYGFAISWFDSELIPNTIEGSEIEFIDASDFKPAEISPFGLTLAPSIFKINEYSIWVFSVTELPLPLEANCYISIYIPGDLAFQNVALKG